MASFDDDDDDGFSEVLCEAVVRYGSLCITITDLQKITGGGRGFTDVLSSYKAMPEWSTQEAMNFRDMMGLIRDACTSFGKLEEAAREYVLRTKQFAKDNIDFVSDVEDEMEPEDIKDLLTDWMKSIDAMKRYNEKIEIVKDQFQTVLEKLEKAKGQAASGEKSGERNANESTAKSVLYAVGGAAGTVAGGALTVATGGLAAIPLGAATASFGGWTFGSAIKSAVDSIKGFFYGPDTTSDDSPIQGKYREWEKAFAHVARQLDSAYKFVGKMTGETTKTLSDLSLYSRQLLDKSDGMADENKIKRIKSNRVQKQFKRLENESLKVKTACIDYIRKDNYARGITGTMAQLSLE